MKIEKFDKAKARFKASMNNFTADAETQLKKLKVLKDLYQPYISCMGTDFWNKCKYILLTCAALPNPASCLISMTCGAINNMKCKKLLPQLLPQGATTTKGTTPAPVIVPDTTLGAVPDGDQSNTEAPLVGMAKGLISGIGNDFSFNFLARLMIYEFYLDVLGKGIGGGAPSTTTPEPPPPSDEAAGQADVK